MPGMSQVIYNDGYNSAILSLVDEGDISIELAAEKLQKSFGEIRKMLEDFVAEKEKQPIIQD